MTHLLLIFLGGGAGSLCRYGVGVCLSRWTSGQSFPWATFAANALGCLLIGLLLGHLERQSVTSLRFLLVTGFWGGFTTFSTFSHEAFRLFTQGHHLAALLYVAASLFAGVLGVAAGLFLAK